MRKYCVISILLFLLACAASRSTRLQTAEEGPLAPPKGILPLETFGEVRIGSSKLNHPQGIAIDFEGSIYITDTGNDRVVKCDSLGNFIKEAGAFGWGEGQFSHPSYITADNGLNIYVADTQNKRVQKFDKDLNYMSSIQLEATADTPGFGLLQGIIIAPSGEIILSDSQEDHLLMLGNLDEYKSSFAGFGQGEGSVLDPMGLDVDEKGNIYVADSQRNRIAIYDLFGNYLRSVGDKFLRKPMGVAVAKDRYIYVANWGMNDLAIFDWQGNLILRYGSWGNQPGKFSHPTDIKVRGELLYVVDSDNSRIQILRLFR